MYHRDNQAETKAAEAAVQRLMETVVSLGGAISGEHGIGLAKTPFLRLQHNPAQIRAMQAVKRPSIRAVFSIRARCSRKSASGNTRNWRSNCRGIISETCPRNCFSVE
jgi:hypothetical protein